jgi:hypothetical protein
VQDSQSIDAFVGEAKVFAYQRLLWDMFLGFGIFTATCCLTLHRAGLNDWTDPISVEYAQGNPLATVFFLTSIGLSLVTGLLYRCYGRQIESLLLFCVLVSLATVIATQPHTTVHFYSFYATVGGAIVTPIYALYRLQMWSHCISLAALTLIVVLLHNWVSATDLGNASIGFSQRAWFIVAWLSNVSVLARCEQREVEKRRRLV